MPSRAILLLVFTVLAAARCGLSRNIDFHAAAQSISAVLGSPTFVPYSRPDQQVEEFVALGDSYTSGFGSNGKQEMFGGGAARGLRSFPMQMYADIESWGLVNGDRAAPRLNLLAHAGDTIGDLVAQQLVLGDFKEGNRDMDRAWAFGRPQLAVMTIGGNDAGLPAVLRACIYRDWAPPDCQNTIADLKKRIDDGTLRDKLTHAFYSTAKTGREAAGANPRESFQLYVLEYMSFYNELTTPCNDISWGFWWWDRPKLTMELRKQLNDLTRGVNEQLKLAVKDLENMGVILVDGLDELYEGHRYCEERHSSGEMIDYDTWFWAPLADTNTPSEGPGEPEMMSTLGTEDPSKLILDFVFPGQNIDPHSISEDSPPWTWNGADKYPTTEALWNAMRQNYTTSLPDTWGYMRSFHPKGTAYGNHKKKVFDAIIANRQRLTLDSIIEL